MILWLLPLCLLGGLLNHVRGGWGSPWVRAHVWSGWGDTGPRMLYSIATAVYGALALRDGMALLIAPLIFGGIVLGWWEAADIGRDRDRSRLIEGLIMTGRGLAMTLPAGIFLWFVGYGPIFGVSGLVLGLIYDAGQRTATVAPGLERGMPIAEVYAGTWFWLMLWIMSFNVP